MAIITYRELQDLKKSKRLAARPMPSIPEIFDLGDTVIRGGQKFRREADGSEIRCDNAYGRTRTLNGFDREALRAANVERAAKGLLAIPESKLHEMKPHWAADKSAAAVAKLLSSRVPYGKKTRLKCRKGYSRTELTAIWKILHDSERAEWQSKARVNVSMPIGTTSQMVEFDLVAG